MKRKSYLTALSAVLISTVIFAGTSSASEIYRWTDEDGNVHYTDKPMGEPSERLDIESRPTDPAVVAAELQARLDIQAKSAESAAVADAANKSQEEKRAEREERQEQCAMYQERMTRFVQNRRIYREGADGERDYLDEDQMTQVRADAQAKVEEYCGN